MVKTIKFEHLVIFEDNQILATARDQDTRRIRLFLINENTGDVSIRHGRCESWEGIYGEHRSFVINNVSEARYVRNIPIFNFKGVFSA